MFCTKCGKELKDGAVFCVHCGAPVKNGGEALDTSAPTPAVRADYVEPDKKQDNPINVRKTRVMLIILIVLSVLFIAGISFGVVYYLNHKDSKKSNEGSSATTEQVSLVEKNTDNEMPKTSGMETEKDEEIQIVAEAEADNSPVAVKDGPKQPGTVVLNSASDNGDISDSKDSSSDQKKETPEERAADGQDDDYMLPGSDSAYISMADLKGFSAEECRIARNEIYARHGRRFKDEELQAYFDGKDWYHGTIEPDSFKEDMLNEYELTNRDLIVEFEKKSGYR